MKSGFALFPGQASTIAPQVDGITIGLLIISGLILALVFGLILVFGVMYRKASPRSREIRGRGENLLEWGWTVATLVVFQGLFVWGVFPYFHMHVPPPGSTEITAIGKQWMWKFQHPNGKREIDELHVPVGEPILMTMTSQDVIHSLFIPEFRVKQDVLPGRYMRLWFQASQTGEFHLFCTQYCGTMHAGMRGRVVAMRPADYQRWLQTGIEGGIESGASRGGRLFTRMGCISCHGMNAGTMAPSLYGIFGKPQGLSDGTTVVADENYIRESIYNPKAKIVMGYRPIMPSYSGLLSESDVLDLIAYIKSLKSTPQGQGPEGPTSPAALSPPPPPSSGANR